MKKICYTYNGIDEIIITNIIFLLIHKKIMHICTPTEKKQFNQKHIRHFFNSHLRVCMIIKKISQYRDKNHIFFWFFLSG
jgi:hypothetical protein